MHFLVTGHTGFKGSWLTLMLTQLGHEVSGVSLDPIPGSLFNQAHLSEFLVSDIRRDIRDPSTMQDALEEVRPDAVFHMAAQPLVRASYVDPQGTIETNVIGTMHVMEAVRSSRSVQAQIIVTTDKVYRNVGQSHGYVESDALGGHDPYSASKAAADIVAQSWVASFDGPPTAIVRAGNVIGGGDASPDRLLPDLIRNFETGTPAEIRYPDAVRPWQHVLDCLNGYLTVSNALLNGQGQGVWNFGPGEQGFVPVREVADHAVLRWNEMTAAGQASWRDVSGDHPHEAALLALDAGKAETELGWVNELSVTKAIDWTIEWEIDSRAGKSAREVTVGQIQRFFEKS